MHASQYTSRSGRLQASARSGFTLIELMITIAVMAILLGVAVPSFNDAVLGSKLGSYANNFVASVNMARSEAIKRNVKIMLCASSDGTNCTASGGWEYGWVVKCKTADNVHCNAAGPNWLTIYRQQALPNGLKISETSAKREIEFDPTGVGATSATLTVCRASPSVGAQERVIKVSSTGRASVSKTTTGSCS